jgi:hypothetical protein
MFLHFETHSSAMQGTVGGRPADFKCPLSDDTGERCGQNLSLANGGLDLRSHYGHRDQIAVQEISMPWNKQLRDAMKASQASHAKHTKYLDDKSAASGAKVDKATEGLQPPPRSPTSKKNDTTVVNERDVLVNWGDLIDLLVKEGDLLVNEGNLLMNQGDVLVNEGDVLLTANDGSSKKKDKKRSQGDGDDGDDDDAAAAAPAAPKEPKNVSPKSPRKRQKRK